MKTADKVVLLRKKNNLSQEDLADRLAVSRQAVSRWESGSALPDAVNIVQLSKLFGVTTDYLLKDEYQSDADIPLVQTANEQREKLSLKNIESLKLALVLYGLAIIGSVIGAVSSQSSWQLAFSTINLGLFSVIFVLTLKKLLSQQPEK